MQMPAAIAPRSAAEAGRNAGSRCRAALWRRFAACSAICAWLPLHAAGIACPEMPAAVTAVNRDVKAEISANVGTLGKLKAGELAVKTETVAKNLFDKYPNVDRLLTVQTMAATYCSMLNAAAIGDLEKLQRWEVFQSKVLNFGDGGAETKKPARKPADPTTRQQPPAQQPRRNAEPRADGAPGGSVRATVVRLLTLPKTGPLDEMQGWYLQWIRDFFSKAQIVIDAGASSGIREGDYFYTVDDEVKVTSKDRQPLGLIVTPGSELHAVSVAERYTICQLDNWAYGSYFDRLQARLASVPDTGNNSDAAAVAHALSPVAIGEKVVLIPQAERNAWSELNDAYSKAVFHTPAADEKRFRMTVAIEKADLFMRQHPAGYFTPAALFNKGYLQFLLGRHEEATATFNDFLKRYPFHLSAPGAASWIEKASEATSTAASAPRAAASAAP